MVPEKTSPVQTYGGIRHKWRARSDQRPDNKGRARFKTLQQSKTEKEFPAQRFVEWWSTTTIKYRYHIINTIIELGLMCRMGIHLGWVYKTFLPKTFVVSTLLLNLSVFRIFPTSWDSPFLLDELVDFPLGPSLMPIDDALSQTTEVTSPIIRVISSMLGICMIWHTSHNLWQFGSPSTWSKKAMCFG